LHSITKNILIQQFIMAYLSKYLRNQRKRKYSLFLRMFATKIRTLKTKPHILTGIFSILTIISCAKMGSLGGGAKDTVAPVVEKCIPDNGSVHFAGRKAEIYFNEYVSLKDLNSKMIVSPPIVPAPDVVVSGKKIIIRINPDSLQNSRTYQINFGNAIVDVNEGNPLNGFVYSFSTGDVIDSLKLSGTVIDAQTLKPVEGVVVSLYSWENRENFRTYIPQYLTFTDKYGVFQLEYLAEGNYAILALKDANNNYYFDQATESIAFFNTPVSPSTRLTSPQSDSMQQGLNNMPEQINLKLFTEDRQQQYILKTERSEPGKIQIVFAQPNRKAPEFTLKGNPESVFNLSKNNDTLSIWMTNNLNASADSVTVFLRYYSDNSFTQLIADTAYGVISNKSSIAKFTVSIAKQQELFAPIGLMFSNPIATTDATKVLISENKNGEDPISFSFEKTVNPCKLSIESALESGGTYYLILAQGAFTDIYQQKSNADTLSFTMKRTGDYGSLIVILPGTNEAAFAELLLQDKVKYKASSVEGKIVFENILVGKYSIRITQDLNNNGYWDSGNLEKYLQPEPVYYYIGEYEVRSNWQHELEWAVPFNSNDK